MKTQLSHKSLYKILISLSACAKLFQLVRRKLARLADFYKCLLDRNKFAIIVINEKQRLTSKNTFLKEQLFNILFKQVCAML